MAVWLTRPFLLIREIESGLHFLCMNIHFTVLNSPLFCMLMWFVCVFAEEEVRPEATRTGNGATGGRSPSRRGTACGRARPLSLPFGDSGNRLGRPSCFSFSCQDFAILLYDRWITSSGRKIAYSCPVGQKYAILLVFRKQSVKVTIRKRRASSPHPPSSCHPSSPPRAGQSARGADTWSPARPVVR